MTTVTIQSFGYLHNPPPPAAVVIDVRELLDDPAHVPTGEMLDLTGLEDTVHRFVLATPGATALLHNATRLLLDLAHHKPSISVAFGCAGGRHRSVTLAETLARALRSAGHDVAVRHRDIHRPRVIRGERTA